MTTKLTLIALAAATALTGITTGTNIAEAKSRRSNPYLQWEFDSKRPLRGYEGYAGIHGGLYCSYRREPERRCYVSRSGRERCKIVSWRLIQKCY